MGDQVGARIRGCSSVGRAPALQAGGQGFDSPHLHGDAHLRCKYAVAIIDLLRRSNDFLFLENRITNLILKIFSATVSVKGN